MKAFTFLSLTLLLLTFGTACTSNASNTGDSETTLLTAEKVEVFYFHNARRCHTCKTVEEVSRESLKDLYGETVDFHVYSLDEAAGEQKAEELGVSGQTLLIVGGDKKINITNQGFMNATRNPEKLKQIIKEKIDPLLNN